MSSNTIEINSIEKLKILVSNKDRTNESLIKYVIKQYLKK